MFKAFVVKRLKGTWCDMQDSIRLIGMKFAARHGVHSEEKTLFQPFEVDVEIILDLSEPARSDRLEDTIDYGTISREVESVVTGAHCNLIERVAGLIIERISGLLTAGTLIVRVRKPRAPLALPFDTVEVELCREIKP